MRIPINLAACVIAANNADVVRRVVIETHDGDHYAATNEPGLDPLADEPTDYDVRFDALSLAASSVPSGTWPTSEITARAEEFYRWLTEA